MFGGLIRLRRDSFTDVSKASGNAMIHDATVSIQTDLRSGVRDPAPGTVARMQVLAVQQLQSGFGD
jgi:hypothetical protein